MKILFEFAATYCAAIFAGAAAYITLVEHPARMECGTALAATEFGPSYRRAAVMQASLAAIAFVTAIGAWAVSDSFQWLVGGLLIVSVIPFTLIVIRPTNRKLLDPTLDRNSANTELLLARWGKLHAVRTALSMAALLTFCWALIAPACAARSVARAKEAVLRQNLLTLRSLSSQYTLDKHQAPKSLEDLIRAGYITKIPKDPMTRQPDWILDQERIVDPSPHQPGISSVHSSSQELSCDRPAYSTW